MDKFQHYSRDQDGRLSTGPLINHSGSCETSTKMIRTRNCWADHVTTIDGQSFLYGENTVT